MKYKNGSEFLNSLYQDMHMEDVIMHTADKSDSPTEKIEKYFDRLERVHDIAKETPHKMEILKKFYYDKYVIKELPESYIHLQKKIARERGYGNITVTEEMKKEMLSTVQKEQEKSLDMWIDYFTSDDAMYPVWFKHYAFKGMLKLNKFDKEKGEFGKRSKTTTDAFIELNREVLARVYDTLAEEIGTNDEISEEAKRALENGESFKKLYEYYLTNTNLVNRNSDTDGIWVKYDQGSDHKPLWESLQGKNTGWCTAGEETAKIQLSNGDFYVYYTKDDKGEYKEPRIAIRMAGKSKIGEVRGVGKHQNLEGCMTSIAEEKLKEFPDKDKYLKSVHDMKLLTEIDNKVNDNVDLTREELIFLYEVDNKIEGFGYDRDPRIQEIRNKRNNKKDLAFIFHCKEENIGTKLSDFERNNIIYFYGDLEYVDETLTDDFKNLQCIIGSARFPNLTSAEGLNNLQRIEREASFVRLTSARGLNNLQRIGGNAWFNNLTSAEGLDNLQRIGGYASFGNLTSAEGLNNLQRIGGYASFKNLTSAEGLNNLQRIEREASFVRLTSARGLNNLQRIGGNAWFNNLTSAEGLDNLQRIGGYASFGNLTSAEGLNNLQRIECEASFVRLTSARGLNNLQWIGGYARFDSLTSAEGLDNLQRIGGNAWFDNLTSAEGLEHLQRIGGNARFDSLTSAEGLDNLQWIGGNAWFDNLTSAEGLEHLQRIEGDARFEKLTTAEGLNNLQSIGRNAWFESLISSEEFDSLETVGGIDASKFKEEINSRRSKTI